MTPYTATKHLKEEQPLPIASENAVPMKRQLLVRETAHKYDALVDAIAATTTTAGRNGIMDAGAARTTAPAVHTDARIHVSDLRAIFERVPGHAQSVMAASTSLMPPAAIKVAQVARKPVRFDVYGWVMDAADVGHEADDDEDDADAVGNEGEHDDTGDSVVEHVRAADVVEPPRDDAEGSDDDEEDRTQDKEDVEQEEQDETVLDKAVAAGDDTPQDAVDEDERGQCESRSCVDEIGDDLTDDLSSAIVPKVAEEMLEAKFGSDSKSDSKSDLAFKTEVATDYKTTKKTETKSASVGIDDEVKRKTTVGWFWIWGWIWAWIWAISAAIALMTCRHGMVAIRFVPLVVKMGLIAAMRMLSMAWRATKTLFQLQCHRQRQCKLEAEPATIRVVQTNVALQSKSVSNHDLKNCVDEASDSDETENIDDRDEELTSESESECEIEAEVEVEEEPGMKMQSETTKTRSKVNKVDMDVNAVGPRSNESLMIISAGAAVVGDRDEVAVAVPADTALTALEEASALNEIEPAPETEEPSMDAVVAMPSQPSSDQHTALELGSIGTVDRRPLASDCADVTADMTATATASVSLPPTATAVVRVTTNETTTTATTTPTGVEVADVREVAQEVIPILDTRTDPATTMASAIAACTPALVRARASRAQLAAPEATSNSMTRTTVSRRRAIESEQTSRVAPRRRTRRTTIIDSKYLKYETLSESYQRTVAGAAAKRSTLEADRERSTWK